MTDGSLIRLRASVGAHHLSRGRTVLATGPDGWIRGHPDHGLFVHNTRMISRHRMVADGVPFLPVTLSNLEQHSWLGYYVLAPPGVKPDSPDTGSGQIPVYAENTLELRIFRIVGEGMHEELWLANHSPRASRFTLHLELAADFREQVHPEGMPRESHRISTTWSAKDDGGVLVFRYDAHHTGDPPPDGGEYREIHRELHLEVSGAGGPVTWRSQRLGFPIQLAPGGTWQATLDHVPYLEGHRLATPPSARNVAPERSDRGQRQESFLEHATRFPAPLQGDLEVIVPTALERARRDLVALRLHDLDRDEGWTMAAGVPQYVALFGRDVLTASWQAGMLGPEMMCGSLAELAHRQGRRVDDWTDEQPGRMLHEAHTGPLEMLRITPRAGNYGSITTSGFYPVVVSELWHWTGDRAQVESFVDPALAALSWMDEHADLDGDGFYEYLTRSPDGVKHQAWKDSPDAIVDTEGRPVEPPIATCEEQAFAYIAKLHLSEVLWWLGRSSEAQRLFREARDLKDRFNQAFWMPEEGFFAMGLDEARRPIRSIASNAGHTLPTGIADSALVPRTAARLLAEDLFSGWGVRTLSSAHPAYNPFSYHRGSVWPVENASFVLGLVRYGLHESAARLARGLFEVTGLFESCRLPETFSGHPKDANHPFPSLYPRANSPQAWSASAVICIVQSLLGLYPYAPLRLLLLDPQLPEWLPRLTVEGLRVGEATVSLRFVRDPAGRSDYEVLELRGTLHILRQPSPWSLSATHGERLRDFLSSLLPRH